MRCLLARRMVERGVRFVQVYCGDTNGWDAHSDLVGNHRRLCCQSDLPIAGLLRDLKARGLLQTPLVIWGGEFGRTPMTEGTVGRDHNPFGFTTWTAGGGVKGGQVIGSDRRCQLAGGRKRDSRSRSARYYSAFARTLPRTVDLPAQWPQSPLDRCGRGGDRGGVSLSRLCTKTSQQANWAANSGIQRFGSSASTSGTRMCLFGVKPDGRVG